MIVLPARTTAVVVSTRNKPLTLLLHIVIIAVVYFSPTLKDIGLLDALHVPSLRQA
jgi:hypothetical protein